VVLVACAGLLLVTFLLLETLDADQINADMLSFIRG